MKLGKIKWKHLVLGEFVIIIWLLWLALFASRLLLLPVSLGIAAVLLVLCICGGAYLKSRKSAKSGLIAGAENAEANKRYLEKRLKSRRVILIGDPKECEKFYKKYASQLKIRGVFADEDGAKSFKHEGKTIKIQSKKKALLYWGCYVIICRPSLIHSDTKYRDTKKWVKKTGRVISKDFTRSDVASMILDHRKLWLWFGYCQIETLEGRFFSKFPSITKEYLSVTFRYELHTVKSSHKYEDCVEMMKLCEVMTYTPLMVAQGKMDCSFDELLPKNVQKVSLPRMPFVAYYPYRESSDETFFKFSVDGKKHWPYAYQEVIIDNMVIAGKTDDEIYEELMREDLIPEKTIQRAVRYAYKFIEVSEKTSDIKILDYIKENLTKQLLYRDGIHYSNCLYFELARRIVAFLGIQGLEDINAMEASTKKSGVEILGFTEVPILPCVANALGLEYITDETLWLVRTTENGSWRGKITYQKLTRKEWIYGYASYMRACYELSKHWNLLDAEGKSKFVIVQYVLYKRILVTGDT